MFITFEGPEGGGKTSLIEKVFRKMREAGIPALATKEPGGTPAGACIRELLLRSDGTPLGKRAELLLFLADRAQHVEECIIPALRENRTVLCDRFNDSTLAYQGVARGEEGPFLESLCRFAGSDLVPDLTFLLDLPPEVGLRRRRGGVDRMEKEDVFFHTKVREGFLRLAEKAPSRFRVVDATRPREDVLRSVLDELEHLFTPL
ncbi:MAG: dTMP kinase [Simkaniaceae bacterium]|nr:dTMP kinase [Simkaniaceae bacterium]